MRNDFYSSLCFSQEKEKSWNGIQNMEKKADSKQ